MKYDFSQDYANEALERADSTNDKLSAEVFRLQKLLAEARELLHDACINLIESDYEVIPNRIDVFLDETAEFSRQER